MDLQQQAYLRKQQVPFTMVANAIIFDNRISSKAKFYYVYLSSKPNDWKFHTNCIIKEIKEGRDAFYNGLKELIEFGYLERQQIKENGKFRHTDYLLKIPYTENTDTESTDTENTDYNNKDKNNKDKNNRDREELSLSQFQNLWELYYKPTKPINWNTMNALQIKAFENFKKRTKEMSFEELEINTKAYLKYKELEASGTAKMSFEVFLNEKCCEDYQAKVNLILQKQGKSPLLPQKSTIEEQKEDNMKELMKDKRDAKMSGLKQNEKNFTNHIQNVLKTYFSSPIHKFWIEDFIFAVKDSVGVFYFTSQKYIDTVKLNKEKFENVALRELKSAKTLKVSKIELLLIDYEKNGKA